MDRRVAVSGESNVEITTIKDGQLGNKAQAGVFSVDFSNTTLTNTGTAAANVLQSSEKEFNWTA